MFDLLNLDIRSLCFAPSISHVGIPYCLTQHQDTKQLTLNSYAHGPVDVSNRKNYCLFYTQSDYLF